MIVSLSLLFPIWYFGEVSLPSGAQEFQGVFNLTPFTSQIGQQFNARPWRSVIALVLHCWGLTKHPGSAGGFKGGARNRSWDRHMLDIYLSYWPSFLACHLETGQLLYIMWACLVFISECHTSCVYSTHCIVLETMWCHFLLGTDMCLSYVKLS